MSNLGDDNPVVSIESPSVLTDLATCPNSGPCLLCISDLEGCLENAPLQQHTHLCSNEFFGALTIAMTNNPNMQVVFLGDYFDQGPHMVKSIKGITKLHTTIAQLHKNDNTTYKLDDRVHIILGNRDVNKLRTPLEAILDIDTLIPDNNTTISWVPSDVILNLEKIKVTGVGRTQEIISKTYGRGNIINYLSEELTMDANKIHEYFNSIFNDSKLTDDTSIDEFAKAIKLLFTEGKLIKIIGINDTKFLASHAGSIDTCVFENVFLEPMLNESIDELKYFQLIDHFRIKLKFDKNNSIENKNLDIEKAILFYNTLLTDVVKSVFEKGINNSYTDDTFKKKYSLLQALALNTKKTEETYIFRSPIQSCGLVSGCGRFISPEEDFVQLLKSEDNNIKGCIHGHIPFCGTVPLIFKTPDNNGIVEIACDTSNGNRPKSFNGKNVNLHQVPLAIVYPSGAGITSITGDKFTDNDRIEYDVGTLSNKHTLGLSNDGTDNRYENMIGFFEFTNDDTFPTLAENKIKYPLGEFSFQAENGFKPASFEPHQVSIAAAAEGGKRKTRRHKITKNKNKRNNKKGKTLRNKRRTIRKR
jgi:hypothetical protein